MCGSRSSAISSQRVGIIGGRGGLPLVRGSEAGKLDGRRPAAVAGMTEVMSIDSGVLAQEVVRMARGIPAGEVSVLGHDARGWVACACGVEVGRGVAAAAAVGERARGVAVGVAIVVAVGERAQWAAVGVAIAAVVGEGTEVGRVAAVAVAHMGASPRRDMRALVLPAGGTRRRKP